MDVAGRVEAVGAKVTRFRPGDEVFGWCDGSFAEYACAAEDHFQPKPAALSFEQAAVVPISAFAALQACGTRARSSQGRRSWSSGRRVGSARSRSSWPRRSGPR
jgi:NADPH:quinone reductase-like Zn-dependent oxidoreductase